VLAGSRQVGKTTLAGQAATQSGLPTRHASADEPTFWGRLAESAVGAHLANAAAMDDCDVHYWRDRNREVDFVVSTGRTLVAIEVKSGRAPETLPGMAAFSEAFRPTRKLLVGGDGIALETFLSTSVESWLS